MNKEQQELLDEVYENYLNNFIKPICPPNLDVQPDYYKPMTKEWFVKSAKERGLRGEEFSEKWGLTIEERELSFNERIKHIVNSLESNAPLLMENDDKTIQWLDKNNVPTKLITITYNDKTITSYE
jgi:hypothetical protein